MSEILKHSENVNDDKSATQEQYYREAANGPEKNSHLRLVDTGFTHDSREGHHSEVLHNYVTRLDSYDISKEAPEVYDIIQRTSTQAIGYDQGFNKHVYSTKSLNDRTVYSTTYNKEEFENALLGILPTPPDFPDVKDLSFTVNTSVNFHCLIDDSQMSSPSTGRLSVSMVHENDSWIVSLESYGYKETDISDREKFRPTLEQFTLKYSKKMPSAKLNYGKAGYKDALDHRVGGSFETGKRR